MLVLILHHLATGDFQRVFAHQLMSACVMEYQILVNYRFPICISNIYIKFMFVTTYTNNNSFGQSGDIINIDVTVYLNVCSYLFLNLDFRPSPYMFVYITLSVVIAAVLFFPLVSSPLCSRIYLNV